MSAMASGAGHPLCPMWHPPSLIPLLDQKPSWRLDLAKDKQLLRAVVARGR